MRLLAGRLLCMAVIALAAPQPAFSQDQIEIVHFESLTFPGSLFSPPFMPLLEEATPVTVFGILRLRRVMTVCPPWSLHMAVQDHGSGDVLGSSLRQLGVATFVVNSFVGPDSRRTSAGGCPYRKLNLTSS